MIENSSHNDTRTKREGIPYRDCILGNHCEIINRNFRCDTFVKLVIGGFVALCAKNELVGEQFA
jgi:hypothetical protein